MEIRTVGGEDFRSLGRVFRKAANGAELRKKLTKTLKAEAQTAADDVKSAVRAVQSRGVAGGGSGQRHAAHAAKRKRAARGGHGLRASVARSVEVRVKYSGRTTGVRIFVDTALMPGGQQKLPRYLNTPRGWRHPVYGHGPWVRQTGQEFWEPPIRSHVHRIRSAITTAVHEALRELR